MHKGFIKTAAILGAVSVVLGAFAAHALKQRLPAAAVDIFETGVRYQFYHVFALFITGVVYKEYPVKLIRWAGVLFVTGIFLFSGSLYLLSYIQGASMPQYRWVGAITPFGGVAFIAAWIFLFMGMSNKPVR